jgi:hypothetical protein
MQKDNPDWRSVTAHCGSAETWAKLQILKLFTAPKARVGIPALPLTEKKRSVIKNFGIKPALSRHLK